MNTMRMIAGLCLVMLQLFVCQGAFGQGIVTGSMTGTVVDSTGAIIPGAKITAIQVETNTKFEATSNDTGFFSFPKLPPGAYNVIVEANNFRTSKLTGNQVLVARETALNKIQMQIGGKTEIVEVTGAVPLVESQTSQISMTFDEKKVTDLPIGRGIDQLAMFLPGVATTGSAGRGNNNGSIFSANGQRPRSNNFQIDGQSMNDQSVTGPAIFLENPDIVSEYQVMTNYDASYGRNMGSQVNIITKSGTNGFHGSASEAWRGSRFDSLTNEEKNPLQGACLPGQDPDADGCNKPQISRYVRNLFGGTVGGPILKDKAWFFGSALWDRTREAGSVTTSGSLQVPTTSGISQLEALFPSSAGVGFLKSKFGPLNTAGSPSTIAGTPIEVCTGGGQPTTVGGVRVCSGSGVLHLIDAGTVSRNVGSVSNIRQFTGRGDVQLTAKDRVFARYLIDDENSTNLDYGDGPAGFFEDVPSRGQQFGLDWTHQFNGNFLNQARYNHTRLNLFFGNGTTGCNGTNPTDCPIQIGFGDGTTMGMGMTSSFPQGRSNKTNEWQDNASLTMGKHSFKFGGIYSHQSPRSDFLPNFNGVYTFNTFTDFMTNTPVRVAAADGSYTIQYKENDLAFYFQDDFRLRSDFTLSFGMRWEYYQNTINQIHDLTVARQTGSDPFWNTSLPIDLTTIPKSPEDKNNFGPIFGFAYNYKEKTTIRGGFRIAYDPSFYNIHLNVASGAPVVNAKTIANSLGDPVVPGLPSSGFDGTAARAVFLPYLPVGLNPGIRTQSQVASNFHNPYSEQWNFGIQRELSPKSVIEVRYLGNHSVGLFQNINGNVALNGFKYSSYGDFSSFIPAGMTPCTTVGAPGFGAANSVVGGYADCNHIGINVRANKAGSNYNGLQSRFDIRAWHGLTSTLSYTWSHAIDNASDIYSTAGAGMLNMPQNPFDNGNGERGNSNFDYRHAIGLQVVYELPFFAKQSNLLEKVLGGWQSTVTYRYATGQPWNPVQSRSNTYFNGSTSGQLSFCDTGVLFSSSTDACRPILMNENAPFTSVGYITGITGGVPTVRVMGSTSTTTLDNVHWLVNNAFAAQYFGNPYLGVGRNTLTGQPTHATNLSMQKNFKLTERFNFQLRATAFNVLNHMFLGVPGNNVMRATATGSFGKLGYNASGGGNPNTLESGLQRRRLEFGGKLTF